jgi:hypothetical protein
MKIIFILILPFIMGLSSPFAGKDEMNGIKFKEYKNFPEKWALVTIRFRKDTGGIWLTKDGERLHGVSLWHKHKTQKRSDLEVIYGKPLFNVTGGQHRYFYFYDKKLKKELTVNIEPYPKQDNIKQH